jgi:GR25 family glycosyltransferase involved in LPS biosynthesis
MKFKIYCINLYERDDRYNYVKKEFNKYNLNVHFVRNYKHKLGGRYGCFDSHIQCLKDAKKNNIDVCLVFEDDISLTQDCNKIISNCLNFIKKNKQTDIIYGGGRYLYLDKHITNNIYSGKSSGAFCVFITKKLIKLILSNYKKYIATNLHYDHYLYFFAKNSFISINSITILEPFGSNNSEWGNGISSIIKKKIINHTCLHFKFKNLLILIIFMFLISCELDFIKYSIIKNVNQKHSNKGIIDIKTKNKLIHIR